MRFERLAGFAWPGMVLVGLALAGAVWAAWPEPTVRVVRLPYGEAAPKTPVLVAAPAAREAATAPAKQVAAVPRSVEKPRRTAAIVQPEQEEAGRVLAAVEPAPAAKRAPASPATAAPATPAKAPEKVETEKVETWWGPDPIESELDGLPGYAPESPEQLGAEPLPGVEVTQPPPPAAG